MATEAAIARDRMRRAVLAFRAAQSVLLNAQRRMKALPQADVDTYWAGPGRQVKADVRAAAAELDAAFEGLSGASQGIEPADLGAVAVARQYLAATGGPPSPEALS